MLVGSQIGIGGVGGDILKAVSPGGGQLAGEVHLAGEHIGQSVAAFLTALDIVNQGADMQRIQEGNIDDTACIDHHNKVLIVFGYEFQILPLHIVQAVVTLLIKTVIALACLPGQHIDGGIAPGFSHIFLRYGNAGGMLEGAHHVQDLAELPDVLDLFFLLQAVGFIGIGIELVKPVQPGFGGDFKACVFQTLGDTDAVALPDLAGAGTALDGHPGTGAIEGNFFILQGKDTVVFQKNEALSRGFSCQSTVAQLKLSGFRIGSRFYNFHRNTSFLRKESHDADASCDS